MSIKLVLNDYNDSSEYNVPWHCADHRAETLRMRWMADDHVSDRGVRQVMLHSSCTSSISPEYAHKARSLGPCRRGYPPELLQEPLRCSCDDVARHYSRRDFSDILQSFLSSCSCANAFSPAMNGVLRTNDRQSIDARLWRNCLSKHHIVERDVSELRLPAHSQPRRLHPAPYARARRP